MNGIVKYDMRETKNEIRARIDELKTLRDSIIKNLESEAIIDGSVDPFMNLHLLTVDIGKRINILETNLIEATEDYIIISPDYN
jgi:hypothetical protein